MRTLLAGSRSVKVRRLPTQEADDNCSNEEQKSDSGDFGRQKFLDFTMDLESETTRGLNVQDS